MNYKYAFYLLISIVCVLVIVIVFCAYKMTCPCQNSCSLNGGDTPQKMFKGAYLNYNSTNYKLNNEFNISDSLYSETELQRKELDALKDKIKNLVGASKNASVIFMSSATEAIATCCHWIQNYNPYGVVIGSDFDHQVVEENCKLYNLKYEKTLETGKINDRCSAIFMTHVSALNGEILDINSYCKNLKSYQFLTNNNYTIGNAKKVLQYKPLLILDATQSITKIPIEMYKNGINAVLFSAHKIGGDIGMSGILVIDDTKDAPFIPLLAGNQNEGLRGGSLCAKPYLKLSKLLDHKDDYNSRVQSWTNAYNYLSKKNINVFKPTHKHLYNTLLLDIQDKCPMEAINELSKKGIYVSSKSACTNEKYNGRVKGGDINGKKTIEKGQKLKEFDNSLRISFLDPNDISNEILDEVVKTIYNIK